MSFIVNKTIFWDTIPQLQIAVSVSSLFFYIIFTSVLITVFYFIYKKSHFYDTKTFIHVSVFIILSILFGRGINFYTIIPFYDKLLHFLSGIIFSLAGKSLYLKAGGDTKNKILRKVFVLFAVLSSAVIWEIWEFASDNILGTNAQNSSLDDTMADVICASVSAVFYCIFKA